MNRKFNRVLFLGILLVFSILFLMGCGPDYQDWLSKADATDAQATQWAIHGTPTPTFTPTPISSPTPTATETPLPTATPFSGYWVVDNKIGKVIALAEFQPECSGEWGYPGMDIWQVVDGQATTKVCGTPWNRPQNMAVSTIGYTAIGLVSFVLILIASNELRKYKLAKKRKATLALEQKVPAALPEPKSQDPITVMIKQLATHDNVVAGQLFDFRREHRQEIILARVKTVLSFAEFVKSKDGKLYEATQAALEKAANKKEEL